MATETNAKVNATKKTKRAQKQKEKQASKENYVEPAEVTK